MPTTIIHARKRSRIYLVTHRDSAVEHLVKASQRHSALSHVATSDYDVRKAQEDDLERLLPTLPVEVAINKKMTAE